jgi:AAA domain
VPRRLMGAEQIREIPVWVGRDKLLDELGRELLENRRKVIVLVGQGGIGKTSLAVKLLERAGIDLASGQLAESCDYVRVVYVRVAEGMGFEEVAGDILRGAIADIGGIKPEALLRLVIEQMQKAPMLLVLDNLEDILQAAGESQPGRAKSAEWGQLLNDLAHKNHRSQIVITSREKPKDLADVRARGNTIPSLKVAIYEIEGLSPDAGAEAFQANGVQDELPPLRRVVERIGGHTLGIELLAGYAVEYLEG